MLLPLISALILMSNFQFYNSLLYKKDSLKNVRNPPVANIFISFSPIIDIKIGYLKLDRLVLKLFKTIY